MQIRETINLFLQNRIKNSLISTLLVLLLGVVDWQTGEEISFQFFYFIPLSLVALNERQTKFTLIIWSAIVAIAWFLAYYFALNEILPVEILIWNTLSRFIVFLFFVVFLNTIVRKDANLKLSNTELAKTNRFIEQSVDYAYNIQNAVIPDYAKFSAFFEDTFILSKPKDVVSGDFFWSYTKGDKMFFAIADCTGHGIPGALLSIIGVVSLNKVVIERNIEQPADILFALNRELITLFDAGNEMVEDGMDVSMIVFEKKTCELTIAQTTKGAVLIEEDETIYEFPADIYTIGGVLSRRNSYKFSQTSRQIPNGSMLYLFSDGYADQFGSPKNIKFGLPKLYKLFKKSKNLPASKQSELILSEHKQWKLQYPQTDDITLVGVKF